MFAEAIEEILRDQCSPSAVRAIESGGSPVLLWDAVENAGFLELLAGEKDGGAALPLAELYPILAMLGRYAAPLPIAQSMLARAMFDRHADVPTGMVSMAPACRRNAGGELVCAFVPFGLVAEHVLAHDAGTLLVLDCSKAQRSPSGVHGSQCATLTWPDGFESTRYPGRGETLRAGGAALHAALLAGAMQRVFAMTLQYANERAQFGKSIGKFQAIQHQISVMAEHVAAASIAAEAAFQGRGKVPDLLPSAIAKSRTSEAAALVASIAHAVHGAIGVTEEFDLQLFTRRLHEWRVAHGSEEHWNLVVGRSVLARPFSSLTDFVRSVSA